MRKVPHFTEVAVANFGWAARTMQGRSTNAYFGPRRRHGQCEGAPERSLSHTSVERTQQCKIAPYSTDRILNMGYKNKNNLDYSSSGNNRHRNYTYGAICFYLSDELCRQNQTANSRFDCAEEDCEVCPTTTSRIGTASLSLSSGAMTTTARL